MSIPPCRAGFAARLVADLAEAEGAELGEQQEHAEEEAEVADAVDDEGFSAGVRGGFPVEVEADEQIGCEADAFPADEHQQVVLGEDQNSHEKEEEVEVAEVAPVAVFMGHVADGVDVDEEAYAGDDQEHDQRELVEGEGEVDMERRRR